MKSGAGEDPFADVQDEAESPGVDEPADAGDELDQQLPWALERDSVKSDRPELLQIFAREETADRERGFFRAVEDELETDVYKMDAREAALLVAMERPEEVAAKLREWGCHHL